MQRGIWTILHPLLSRRFRTNDGNLCYYCIDSLDRPSMMPHAVWVQVRLFMPYIKSPLQHSLPINNPTPVKQCDKLFSCVFHKHSRIWEQRHSKDSSHCWETSTGSIKKWILRRRDLYVRSLRSDQYPCHSGKGTSICQHSYFVLNGLWCHWCYGK